MAPHVLCIGYPLNEQEAAADCWKVYHIAFECVETIGDAVPMLPHKDYICVIICTDIILQNELSALRHVCSVPIVVVPPSYSEKQRCACIHLGAAQYLHTYHQPLNEATNVQNSLCSYLNIPSESREPLTIITVKDLSFCLEYRSVEIAGKPIDLTEKEFDILALLIMNQRQVFTYQLIMDAVWNEDYSFYSRNALSSHISNLRKKLRVSASAADHIKSIRGVGYKFEV